MPRSASQIDTGTSRDTPMSSQSAQSDIAHERTPNQSIRFIIISRSDGDRARMPKQSYWKKIEEDLESTKVEGPLVRWYRGVGEALARAFKWEVDPTTCILSRLPEGYTLYNSTSGHRADGSASRNDFQLYGHRSHRFRTPAEFIEHAIWLYGEDNGESCKCIGCGSGRSQKHITNDLKDRGVYPEALNPSKRSAAQPIHRHLATAPGGPTSLLAHVAHTELHWCRPGELVHIALDEPLQASDSGLTISFWPAIFIQMVPKNQDLGIDDSSNANGLVVDKQSMLIRLLGLASSSTAETSTTRVSQQQVFPYSPQLDSLPVDSSLTSRSSGDDDNAALNLYTQATQRAHRVLCSWSIVADAIDRSLRLRDASTLIQPTSIWWGGEQIRKGDFVRVNLSESAIHDLVPVGTRIDELITESPLFARVYTFQSRVPDEAGDGDGELMMSVALYKLGTVEEGSENLPDTDRLPVPPSGFYFVCAHDPESEVVLTGNCLLGRYYPEVVAGELLESHISLVGRDLSLERLDHFWEMQGLQRSEPAEKVFTSQCIVKERGST
ncbi:hypothetical protein PQX77_003071 [Marasmius sp. AFHP31]|nr:hypothetical protein PQX77_003071 [Marasmius sp. AFHP31]